MKNKIILLFLLIAGNTFSQMPNTLTKAEKVYGLSKFWQEANYNFIYLNKIDRDEWNAEYKKLITEVQETANDYEYYRLLQKFCALLKDGHTGIRMPKAIDEKLLSTDFGEYRLFLTNIEGKAIVTQISVNKKKKFPSEQKSSK